jgi:hypothetical protein
MTEEGDVMKDILPAAAFTSAMGACLFAPLPAAAQSVTRYRCSDGTRFIVGFYPQDPRALTQIGGGKVTLAR